MLLDLAQRIIQSIECSKSWKAQIMVQGTTFYNSSTLNLVDYLHTSLARDDSFPKDTCLRFDNFEGLDSKEHIVKYIKEEAREGGTVLCHMVIACKDTSDRLCIVKFQCCRGKVSTAEARHFEESFMQQPQTVVQRNHRPHTVKGRPCHNQLALCPSQVSGNVRKLRESTQ